MRQTRSSVTGRCRRLYIGRFPTAGCAAPDAGLEMLTGWSCQTLSLREAASLSFRALSIAQWHLDAAGFSRSCRALRQGRLLMRRDLPLQLRAVLLHVTALEFLLCQRESASKWAAHVDI